MPTRLIILGASGHGRVALDTADVMGLETMGFIDISFEIGQRIDGIPLVAREPEDYAALRSGDLDWFVAIGNDATRQVLTARVREICKRPALNLIHPQSVLSTRATLASGIFIGAGVVINTGSRLGDGVIVNTSATIDHDCEIGEYAQIGPGCHLAGNVTLGTMAFVGTGASVIPGRAIGAGAVVGAGSVVVHDIPENAVAYGTPARVKKR